MIEGAVAQRYARALLLSATEQDALGDVAKNLASLAKMLDSSAELAQLVSNPMLSGAERGAVVLAIARQIGCHDLTATFLQLLSDKGRLKYLRAIAAAYARLADEQQGRLRAEVRSTAPLMPDELKQIQAALAARTGKEVIVETAVDPDLLGGVVARVGDTVYDSSVRSHLARLRQNILEA